MKSYSILQCKYLSAVFETPMSAKTRMERGHDPFHFQQIKQVGVEDSRHTKNSSYSQVHFFL